MKMSKEVKMKGKVVMALIVMLLSFVVLAGCAGKEGGTAKGMSIGNLVFCSKEPNGYMDYGEQPNATYKPGDTVWIYFNLRDQQYKPNPDGTNEMWFTEYVTVREPSGDILLSQEVVNEHQNFPKELDPDKVFLQTHITTTPELAEGEYTVEIVVADKLANTSVSALSKFTLRQ
jgi:hypothetical protein